MTDEELQQFRTIVRETVQDALAPVESRLAAIETAQTATGPKLDRVVSKVDRMDTKLDRVIDRADDILAGVVRLRTDVENRDAGIRQEIQEIDNLRERVEALEGKR